LPVSSCRPGAPDARYLGEYLNSPRKRLILCVTNPKPGQTSGYRAQAFRRLGQDLIIFDVSRYHSGPKILAVARDRFPVGPLIYRINRDLLRALRLHRPDVVWFDKPIHFTRATIEAIKQTGAQTICYNQDNPFGPHHDSCWRQFYRVFRLFDLHCLFREADVARYSQWGLPWIRTMFSFEPSMQFPPPTDWSDSRRTRSVSYVGSPYEDRPQFLRRLGDEQHIPLVIAGPRWEKLLPSEILSRYVSDAYLSDSAYREAIWKSRINLSFVTHFNEDDISHKSVEIAACQGFLLALRTEGHQALFEEDREAVFFSSLEECADKCRFYLDRPDLRDAIAQRGRERAVRSGYDNDTQLARILTHLDGGARSAALEG
jgi:spore maturation protein CgeB